MKISKPNSVKNRERDLRKTLVSLSHQLDDAGLVEAVAFMSKLVAASDVPQWRLDRIASEQAKLGAVDCGEIGG